VALNKLTCVHCHSVTKYQGSYWPTILIQLIRVSNILLQLDSFVKLLDNVLAAVGLKDKSFRFTPQRLLVEESVSIVTNIAFVKRP
jgi:hypothetical protein